MSNKAKGGNWFGRHKVLTIIGAIVILGIIGAAISNNKTNTNTTATTTNTSSTTPSSKSTSKTTTQPSSTPGLNQQANDGKLGFTVTSLQCGLSTVGGSDTGSSTAGAPYCEMNLSVKGVSTVPQTFDDDSQYVYSSTGKQYAVDDDATIDANPENSNCMEDPTVNPGVTITCTLVFDVPSSVTPSYAILHDSQFSNGVKVNLQ